MLRSSGEPDVYHPGSLALMKHSARGALRDAALPPQEF